MAELLDLEASVVAVEAPIIVACDDEGGGNSEEKGCELEDPHLARQLFLRSGSGRYCKKSYWRQWDKRMKENNKRKRKNAVPFKQTPAGFGSLPLD